MAGNAFLMDFLKRGAQQKCVLGPSTEGEDMTEPPKTKKPKAAKKEVVKEKPAENPVHAMIRDDRWTRTQVIEYLRTLV